MGVETDAILCWGLEVDTDLTDEAVIGDRALGQSQLVLDSDFQIVSLGCHYTSDLTHVLAKDHQSSRFVSVIDPPEKPSVEEVAEMISLREKLYGGQQPDEAPELELYLGLLVH